MERLTKWMAIAWFVLLGLSYGALIALGFIYSWEGMLAAIGLMMGIIAVVWITFWAVDRL